MKVDFAVQKLLAIGNILVELLEFPVVGRKQKAGLELPVVGYCLTMDLVALALQQSD